MIAGHVMNCKHSVVHTWFYVVRRQEIKILSHNLGENCLKVDFQQMLLSSSKFDSSFWIACCTLSKNFLSSVKSLLAPKNLPSVLWIFGPILFALLQTDFKVVSILLDLKRVIILHSCFLTLGDNLGVFKLVYFTNCPKDHCRHQCQNICPSLLVS